MAIAKKTGTTDDNGHPLWQLWERGAERTPGGADELDPVGPPFCKFGCDLSLGGR